MVRPVSFLAKVCVRASSFLYIFSESFSSSVTPSNCDPVIRFDDCSARLLSPSLLSPHLLPFERHPSAVVVGFNRAPELEPPLNHKQPVRVALLLQSVRGRRKEKTSQTGLWSVADRLEERV